MSWKGAAKNSCAVVTDPATMITIVCTIWVPPMFKLSAQCESHKEQIDYTLHTMLTLNWACEGTNLVDV